ncbi:hypothetical protein [Dactylosporangium darangshiense]|uniref:hypothetical protein n=1 Tax=Dactylosporangium darangshiense TaxID=579108 RepID=UPI0031E644CE
MFTASCWLSANACCGSLGQRPAGTASGAVAANTRSIRSRTSTRPATGISASERRYSRSAVPMFPFAVCSATRARSLTMKLLRNSCPLTLSAVRRATTWLLMRISAHDSAAPVPAAARHSPRSSPSSTRGVQSKPSSCDPAGS